MSDCFGDGPLCGFFSANTLFMRFNFNGKFWGVGVRWFGIFWGCLLS